MADIPLAGRDDLIIGQVDPLDESGTHTNAERMDAAMTPDGVALLLKNLTGRESYWRDRLGDDVYDGAVSHWRAIQRRWSEH